MIGMAMPTAPEESYEGQDPHVAEDGPQNHYGYAYTRFLGEHKIAWASTSTLTLTFRSRGSPWLAHPPIQVETLDQLDHGPSSSR